MRNLILASLVLWSNAVAAQDQRSPAVLALQDTLVALERNSWVAWKGRDSSFFRTFLSDDHIEVGVQGPYGKNIVVRTVGSPLCAVASYSVDRFRLTMLSTDVAVLNYHAAQDTKCGGNAVPSPVWVTSLYMRRAGRWLNALYQQSPAAPDPPKR